MTVLSLVIAKIPTMLIKLSQMLKIEHFSCIKRDGSRSTHFWSQLYRIQIQPALELESPSTIILRFKTSNISYTSIFW